MSNGYDEMGFLEFQKSFKRMIKHLGFVLLSILLLLMVFLIFRNQPKAMDNSGWANRGQSRRPNIIVMLLDCVRPDHLGCYGYTKDTSPNIDKLATQGVVFHSAISQASWTLPSVYSLLSGYYPRSNGTNYTKKKDRHVLGYIKFLESQLAEKKFVLLPELLQQAGYYTWSFSAHGLLDEQSLGKMGFDELKCKNDASATEVVNYAIGKIKSWDKTEKPFFLYLHFIDNHLPYQPPKKYYNFFPTSDGKKNTTHHENWRFTEYKKEPKSVLKNHKEHIISLYDANIRYTDNEIGRLLKKLEITEQLSHTVIVILADHGEEFLEHADFEFTHYRYIGGKKHGTGHGHSLFQELIRVPLIITNLHSIGKFSFLKRKQKEVREFVQLVDMVPTLLDYIDLPPLPHGDGDSLLPLIFKWRLPFYQSSAYRALAHRSILSESTSRGNLRISLIEAPYKFIYSHEEIDLLFNLQEFPLEQNNLICKELELASRMLDKILYLLEGDSPPSVKALTLKKERLEALKSLGYIDEGMEVPRVTIKEDHELSVDGQEYQPLTGVYEKHGLYREAARLYKYCTKECGDSLDH